MVNLWMYVSLVKGPKDEPLHDDFEIQARRELSMSEAIPSSSTEVVLAYSCPCLSQCTWLKGL